MRWKLLLVAVLAFLVLPTPAGAVDFTISDVEIRAQLGPDGTVGVKEKHTYDFDSKFNGIIREIQPKRGASIEGFTAYEQGKGLEVEKRDAEYRVHRKGKNETLDFDLEYTIVNGMKKYEDGAEFYWPFFDSRNETDYGKMTITIVPPKKASDVLLIGYDSAEETGELQPDGTVVFSLGEVDAGTKGDIRVIYEPSLFPAMTAASGKIRPEVEKEQEAAAASRAAFIDNQKTAGTLGGVGMAAGLAGVGLIGLLANARRRKYIKEADYQIRSDEFRVPSEGMSLPAMLLFKKGAASFELMSAALLDLVRKGHVKQTADDEFELLDANVQLEHEQQLIQLLFFQIGDGTTFTLEELERYTKDEKNYETFNEKFTLWQACLKAELKQQDVKVKTTKERVILCLVGVAGIGLAIYTAYYEHYFQLALLILLSLAAFGFALFYSPYNYDGMLLKRKWDRVDRWMKELDMKKWEGLSLDDRFRVLIYGVGMKNPELEAYYKDFVDAQEQLGQHRTRSGQDIDGAYYGSTMVYNPIFLAGSFNQASANVSDNTPASSSGGGGGGVGGGGGGSGAF